ncbi:hypothetical protein [Actinomarinicola tropica]|uniref:LppX_LprAFG lipoprotein n=1 Tax=Actinomarinicola tropica TaxID=2789776 RepID=A0A5Q2RH16_9ACTN|nr:hypothetical protein [Actinomarinicola tropica]QGG96108.1 hypothetical protein GH723_13930 [Actinomarinicola tropica]
MSRAVPTRTVHAVRWALLPLLLLAGACSGSGPDPADASSPSPVGPASDDGPDEDASHDVWAEGGVFLRPEDLADALARTREVRTGRYVLGVEISPGVEAAPSIDTHVQGAFDRGADAVTASMDLDETFAGAPELAAHLPAELRGRAVEVRTVAGASWMRVGEDAPWTSLPPGGNPLGGIVPGVDQVLDLLDHAHERIRAHTGGVYSGHVDVRALAGAGGSLAAFAHLADVLPPDAADRLITYRTSMDRDGRIDSVEVELDLAAAAEAVGEAPPAGAALRWRLQLSELDEPLVIAPPADVIPATEG